ncbi:MAG: hypothetical protein ABI443_08530 [Chthoniobacterales bacterium]
MKSSSKFPTLMTALALVLGVIAIGNLHAQIYVTNAPSGAGSITQYNINGSGSSPFATGLTLPYGLALDASGNLYVAASGDTKIFKYNSSRVSLGPSGEAWISTGGATPFGIATSGSNLYVGSTNINEVDQYSAVTANTFNGVWLSNSHGGGTAGTVSYPDGLAMRQEMSMSRTTASARSVNGLPGPAPIMAALLQASALQMWGESPWMRQEISTYHF